MRERLAPMLLSVLLCAGSAFAQQEATMEEEEAPGEPGYEEVRGHGVSLSEGELRASVTNNVLRPSRGYTPLEVTLQNAGSTPRVVHIGFGASGLGQAESITRAVEVGPRQRLVAWVPIPVTLAGGLVRLRSPGVTFQPVNLYMMHPTGVAVLVLGSERAFQAGSGLPRVEKTPRLSVRFVSPEDAPRELAAYVGHAMVVVAGDVTTVPADAWAALEAYAATGGHLALLHPPRDVGARLPLLASSAPGVQAYGFGRARLCGDVPECGAGLLSDAGGMESAAKAGKPVGLLSPVGPPPGWQGSRQMLNNGELPLLPGVQAPVGRFLLLITLFVLAVGPGGLALARRKGPVALLIAVPSVALVTCLAIVAWAVLVEGFSIHASRYSLTWLDRERSRALTVGLGAYFTNLEPEGFRVPALGALLGPDVEWDEQAVEADWTNGMGVSGGFLPSRTYREWGEVAMVSSRARLSLRNEGAGLRVQNALGAPLAEGYARLGGRVWSLPALADGAEGEATPAPDTAGVTLQQLARFSAPVLRRFPNVRWDELGQPLPEGGFIARLEGPGPMLTAALPVQLHEGLHVVYGRVDGP